MNLASDFQLINGADIVRSSLAKDEFDFWLELDESYVAIWIISGCYYLYLETDWRERRWSYAFRTTIPRPEPWFVKSTDHAPNIKFTTFLESGSPVKWGTAALEILSNSDPEVKWLSDSIVSNRWKPNLDADSLRSAVEDGAKLLKYLIQHHVWRLEERSAQPPPQSY